MLIKRERGNSIIQNKLFTLLKKETNTVVLYPENFCIRFNKIIMHWWDLFKIVIDKDKIVPLLGQWAPTFFSSTLNGGEWLASRQSRFTTGQRAPYYALDRRHGGPPNQ
jgi:hypothetical protein